MESINYGALGRAFIIAGVMYFALQRIGGWSEQKWNESYDHWLSNMTEDMRSDTRVVIERLERHRKISISLLVATSVFWILFSYALFTLLADVSFDAKGVAGVVMVGGQLILVKAYQVMKRMHTRFLRIANERQERVPEMQKGNA